MLLESYHISRKNIMILSSYTSQIIGGRSWAWALYTPKYTHYLQKKDCEFWLYILFEMEENHEHPLSILYIIN
jgi:hypothetical protein